MDNTYEGWPNIETWNIAFWIANDSTQCRYWNNLAQNLINEGIHKHDASIYLSDTLQREIKPPKIKSEPWSNFLYHAANQIYWREIAEHLLADKEPT